MSKVPGLRHTSQKLELFKLQLELITKLGLELELIKNNLFPE
jgi:hypothetical protein